MIRSPSRSYSAVREAQTRSHLQPVVDEHGRAWTWSRIAGEVALGLGYCAAVYGAWMLAAVLS